ncbi:MAG: 30S ribosomal protein S4 [Bernardetiaceae bacterium]
MARHRGPKSKIARKFGEPILGPCKELKHKNHPPGQHGRGRRRKPSDYAVQLKEKQKAKYTYGVLERQFLKTFKRAASKQGVTGTNLLRFLEARLDNTVFRLGIAPTRRAARQLVTHKHITVNGEVANIASMTLRPGDIVGVREKSKSLEVIVNSLGSNRAQKYSWLEWDQSMLAGKLLHYPERDEIPENINEQLIVELYSK